MNIGICTSFYNGYGKYFPRWMRSIQKLKTKPNAITIVLGANHGLKIDVPSDVNVVYATDTDNMGKLRNIAVQNTNTEYIMYLDVDDEILPNALNIYQKYEGYDVISGGLHITGDRRQRDKLFLNASLENQLAGEHCCCSHAVYRRKLWEQAHYLEHEFCDGTLWVSFAKLGASFVGTKEVCTIYLASKTGHNLQLNNLDRNYAAQIKQNILHDNFPFLYYCTEINFGDLLSPIIVNYLYNNCKHPHIPIHNKGKLLAVGSILEQVASNDVVFGSGCMYNKSLHLPENVKILATRGPKTASLIGTDCNVYGDPALLMPKIYNPEIKKEHKIGVIPHYVDYKLFNENIHLINVVNPNPLAVIDEMLKCDVIISTSLHGLIVADAYNIPCVWLQVSDKIKGDNFKFYDYFASVGRTAEPIICKRQIKDEDILEFAKHTLSKPIIDTEPLEQSFYNYFSLFL